VAIGRRARKVGAAAGQRAQEVWGWGWSANPSHGRAVLRAKEIRSQQEFDGGSDGIRKWKKSISPSHLWGLDYITPQPMKRSISPPELCKTGQITLCNSFEKS
jgi:hypothetical protein